MKMSIHLIALAVALFSFVAVNAQGRGYYERGKHHRNNNYHARYNRPYVYAPPSVVIAPYPPHHRRYYKRHGYYVNAHRHGRMYREYRYY